MANKLDVAVRRHVRTQIAQDGARLTELRMDEAGIEYVEVSSHAGARPSHQEWEGQVYSRNGRKTVGGVTYEDFRTACHWSDVADGIYGANCRHAHGPWIPGTPRSYEKDPKHPSGLSNDEAYRLNQRQREMERGIRATKRELKGVELLYENDPSPANIAAANQLKEQLRTKQASLRSLVEKANSKGKAPVLQRSARREWAGDMPKVKVPPPAKRTVEQVITTPAVKEFTTYRGIKPTAVSGRVLRDIADDAMTGRSFYYLPRNLQDDYVWDAANAVWDEMPDRDKLTSLIAAGSISPKLNEAKQRAHVEGSKEWGERVRNVRKDDPDAMLPSSISISLDDVQRLIDEIGLDGVMRFNYQPDGTIQVKSTCATPDGARIGIWRNADSGMVEKTDSFTIHYSQSRTHIVPSTPSWHKGAL